MAADPTLSKSTDSSIWNLTGDVRGKIYSAFKHLFSPSGSILERRIPYQCFSRIDPRMKLLKAYCVPLVFGILSDENEELPIYHRKEVENLSSFLEDKLGKQFLVCVDGAPGSGKSVTVWANALNWVSEERFRSLRWVQFRKQAHTVIVTVTNLGDKNNEGANVLFEIRHCRQPESIPFMRNFKGGLMIIDAINECEDAHSIPEEATGWYEQSGADHVTRTAVVVASGKWQRWKREDIHVGEQAYYEMISWPLEDYFDACLHGSQDGNELFEFHKTNLIDGWLEPKTAEDVRKLVRLKYHYAGGSARWLFDFTFSNFEEDFDKYCKRSNDLVLLATLNMGAKGSETITHLLKSERRMERTMEGERYKVEYDFVSEYALGWAMRKGKAAFLQNLAKSAKTFQSPTFNGVAFEGEAVMKIEETQKLRLRIPENPSKSSTGYISEDAASHVWSTGKVRRGLLEELSGFLEQWPRQEDCMAWYSTKFNQATYDMVLFEKCPTSTRRQDHVAVSLHEQVIRELSEKKKGARQGSRKAGAVPGHKDKPASNTLQIGIYVTFLQFTAAESHQEYRQFIEEAIKEIESSGKYHVQGYVLMFVQPTGYVTRLSTPNQFPAASVRFATTDSTFMAALDDEDTLYSSVRTRKRRRSS